MAVYAYKAIDPDLNQSTSGLIVSDSPRQARDELRARGLRVTGLSTQEQDNSNTQQANAQKFNSSSSWSHLLQRHQNQQLSFLRETATLLSVDIPLLQAMDTIIEGVKQRSYRKILLSLRDQVASGVSLADAMSHHPQQFDTLTIQMVCVGENAGALDQALDRLATYKEKAARYKNHLANALIYPAIVFTVSLGATLFLMTWVVPKLLSTLVDAGKPLPLPTQIVKTCSDLVTQQGHWLALIGVMLLVILVMMWKTPFIRRFIDLGFLRLPVIGELTRKQAISRIASVLATLLHSGLPFEKALHLSRDLTDNLIIRETLDQCVEAVQRGESIGNSFNHQYVFPPTVLRVMTVGQESGRLEEMLEKLAADYEYQLSVISSRIATLIEPAVILLLVSMIGFIALATLLPILEASKVF